MCSEDNFAELILFCSYVGSGDRTQVALLHLFYVPVYLCTGTHIHVCNGGQRTTC